MRVGRVAAPAKKIADGGTQVPRIGVCQRPTESIAGEVNIALADRVSRFEPPGPRQSLTARLDWKFVLGGHAEYFRCSLTRRDGSRLHTFDDGHDAIKERVVVRIFEIGKRRIESLAAQAI